MSDNEAALLLRPLNMQGSTDRDERIPDGCVRVNTKEVDKENGIPCRLS